MDVCTSNGYLNFSSQATIASLMNWLFSSKNIYFVGSFDNTIVKFCNSLFYILVFSLQLTVNNINDDWILNRRSQRSEATALPTVPQALPLFNVLQ